MNRLLTALVLYLVCLAVPFAQSETSLWQVKLLFAFGQSGEEPGQFHQPVGITAATTQAIYVADTGNHRIQKFDKNGKLLRFMGGFGFSSGQFQHPMDLHTLNGLSIYVADVENNRIEQYDKDLNRITSIVPQDEWDERFRFMFPSSLAMSLYGELFILDNEQKKIIKLNSQFEPVLAFGGYDWGEGELAEPMQLCVASDEKIYVTDAGMGCVQVFDYFGNHIQCLGQSILQKPFGIARHSSGLILVSDRATQSLIGFDNGRQVFSVGGKGKKLGAFDHIGDIAVIENRIYVVDTDNNRIQVFELSKKEKNR